MNGFCYERKPNYYETDMMGIIHHSNYIRYFEEARNAFMEDMGFTFKKMEDMGVSSPVISVHSEYKSMVRYGDTIKIYCKIKEFTGTRLTVAYEIRDKETDEIRNIGESKHCFLNKNTGRPVSLKKSLPELYEMFMGKTFNE